MDNFTQDIQAWQVFYATVAAACATLTGLLFLALSINVELLGRDQSGRLLPVAQQAFGEFLLVLMVALVFLIPRLGPLGLGVGLLSLGSAYAASLAKRLWDTTYRDKNNRSPGALLRGFGLSLAGCLGVIAIGILMLVGFTPALYGMVFMVTALLASASHNAWSLLIAAPHRKKDKRA